MQEPRKIVLILGNGFDLDLGLKTSYKDFWESTFCPQNYPAPLVRHLNQRWQDNLEQVRWYDLENELLDYYKSIPNPHIGKDYITPEEHQYLKSFKPHLWSFGYPKEEFPIINSLIEKRVLVPFKNPLPGVDIPFKEDLSTSPIERDKKAFQLIKEGFCKYLHTIIHSPQKDNSFAAVLLIALRMSLEHGESVQIYSFNYTPVQYLSQHRLDNLLQYMHGDVLTGNIVIGTRDDKDMVREYDYLQKVIGAPFRRPNIVSALKDANEVIVFGHSMGENDRQYFEPFFVQQSRSDSAQQKTIFFFTKNDESERELKRSLLRMTNNNLSALLCLNSVSAIRTEDTMARQEEFVSFLNGHYMPHYLDFH